MQSGNFTVSLNFHTVSCLFEHFSFFFFFFKIHWYLKIFVKYFKKNEPKLRNCTGIKKFCHISENKIELPQQIKIILLNLKITTNYLFHIRNKKRKTFIVFLNFTISQCVLGLAKLIPNTDWFNKALLDVAYGIYMFFLFFHQLQQNTKFYR